ncbi:MAG: hypothetical protein AAGA90_09170 [Actinomycetota bacterium]
MFARFAPLAAAALVTVAFWSGPAAAQDDVAGLAADAATVVTVDPDGGSVSVVHTYTFRNLSDDQAFSGFFETLPVEARDVTASWAGGSLPAVNIPDGAGFAEWLVSFPDALAPGEELGVELRWTQRGLAGGIDSLDRVSADLVAIAPYAVGHGGTVELTVAVPGEWQIALADGFRADMVDDSLVLVADDPVGSEYVAQPVILEAPDRFARSTVEAGPVSITVATADGTSGWLEDELTPLVERLSVWIPLSPPTDLTFRQGYTAGADLRRDGDVFVLPLDPSAAVAARAVAAAWLEPLAFDDAELRDDLATALADRVARAEGLAAPPNAGTWSTAVAALVSVSDETTMRTIVSALESGLPAYVGAEDTFSDAPIDWRRFTDVAEHLGGIASAGDAMRLSADPEQLAELDARAAALVDFRALEARADPWLLPPLLRDAMAAWAFDEFRAEQASVSDLIAARDEMVAAAELVDLDIGDHVQREFELAETSMDDAWTLLVEQREALDAVAEALRLDTGDRGVLSRLGMAGRDAGAQRDDMQAAWAAGEYVDAAERAEHLVEDYEGSVGRGTLRLLGPLTVVVLVGALIQRLRRRRRKAARAQSSAA